MTDTFSKNQATTAAEAARIIPRAEFRVFGKEVIESVKTHMWQCKAQLFKARVMPPETYVLSRHTDEANVKVRDGLLDIKTKTGETPEGFEIFQPGENFSFPSSATNCSPSLLRSRQIFLRPVIPARLRNSRILSEPTQIWPWFP